MGAAAAIGAIRILRTARATGQFFLLAPQPLDVNSRASPSDLDKKSVERAVSHAASLRNPVHAGASSRLLDRDKVLWRKLYGARRRSGDRMVRMGAG